MDKVNLGEVDGHEILIDVETLVHIQETETSKLLKKIENHDKLVEIIGQLEKRIAISSSYSKFSLIPKDEKDEYLESIKITQKLKAEVGLKY